MIGYEPTPREVQVLDGITQGMTNSEIAAELQISPATVKTHVGRLFLSTGLHKRGALSAWWARKLTVWRQGGRR